MSPKEVVLAYVDAFNRGDVDGVCALFSPDALIWGVLGWGTIEVARPVWKDLMEALEMQLAVDAIVADGNTVVVRYTERGTSVGAFRGLGPTNRSYELLAMEWFEVQGGLIERRWGTRDSGSMNRQLGFGGVGQRTTADPRLAQDGTDQAVIVVRDFPGRKLETTGQPRFVMVWHSCP